MQATTLEIPRDILDSAHLSPSELKQELALSLYTQGRLSVGKARELAGVSLWEFRQLLGARQIAPHFGEQDLAEDITLIDEWIVGTS